MNQKICRFYNTVQGCKFGDNCKFVHSMPSMQPVNSGRAKEEVCFHWMKNQFCKFGDKCRYAHPLQTQGHHAGRHQTRQFNPALQDGTSVPINKQIASKAAVESLKKKWTGIHSFGKPLFVDKLGLSLVCFKCPLDSRYDGIIEERHWLSPEKVVSHYRDVHGLQMLGVIDLTDTQRYYDPPLLGVPHFKMNLTGGKVPSDDYMFQFFNNVERMSQGAQETRAKNCCIGVHCTHGVNRTGYMIVRLLMRLYPSMSVDEALNIFHSHRQPHEIDKPELLADLHKYCQRG